MWIKLLWLEIELDPEQLSELLRHLALLAAFSTLLRLLVLYSNRPDFLQYYAYPGMYYGVLQVPQ